MYSWRDLGTGCPRNSSMPSGRITKVRLPIAVVANVGAVIQPVVVGAKYQHDDRGLDRRSDSLKQQIFLVRAIAGDACIDDGMTGKAASQQIREAFLGFGIDAPDKRISDEQHLRSRILFDVDIPKTQAVMLRMDGPGGRHD